MKGIWRMSWGVSYFLVIAEELVNDARERKEGMDVGRDLNILRRLLLNPLRPPSTDHPRS